MEKVFRQFSKLGGIRCPYYCTAEEFYEKVLSPLLIEMGAQFFRDGRRVLMMWEGYNIVINIHMSSHIELRYSINGDTLEGIFIKCIENGENYKLLNDMCLSKAYLEFGYFYKYNLSDIERVMKEVEGKYDALYYYLSSHIFEFLRLEDLDDIIYNNTYSSNILEKIADVSELNHRFIYTDKRDIFASQLKNNENESFSKFLLVEEKLLDEDLTLFSKPEEFLRTIRGFIVELGGSGQILQPFLFRKVIYNMKVNSKIGGYTSLDDYLEKNINIVRDVCEYELKRNVDYWNSTSISEDRIHDYVDDIRERISSMSDEEFKMSIKHFGEFINSTGLCVQITKESLLLGLKSLEKTDAMYCKILLSRLDI